MPTSLDHGRLWKHVLAAHAHDHHSIHGPDHWRRVEANGLKLAERTGADVDIVRLFALFHDSKRVNEGTDRGHGKRGGAYARELHGTLFLLAPARLDQLVYACTWHTDRKLDSNPTIGTCWDADRLDLTRIGIRPNPTYMSTPYGVELAAAGLSRPG